jgi:beta-mannanase
MIDWLSWDASKGANQADFRLATIASGKHDSTIRQWATGAKAWGHPLFLRFDHEMNGNWQFPWAEQLNGNKPGDYVKAWRHVHDVFAASVGATNITCVWCPNVSGGTPRPMSQLYAVTYTSTGRASTVTTQVRAEEPS